MTVKTIHTYLPNKTAPRNSAGAASNKDLPIGNVFEPIVVENELETSLAPKPNAAQAVRM